MFVFHLIISIAISILVVFVTHKIKRSKNDIYYLEVSLIDAPFSFFLMIIIFSFFNKWDEHAWTLAGVAFLFLVLFSLPLFEYNKIVGDKLIIRNSIPGRRIVINIEDIESVEYVMTTGEIPHMVLKITAKNNIDIKIKKEIEDRDLFLRRLKEMNGKIYLSDALLDSNSVKEDILSIIFFSIGFYFIFSKVIS